MYKVAVVIAEPSFTARKEQRRLTGYEQGMLFEKAARAGLMPSDIQICTLDEPFDAHVVVPMGERALNAICGKKSIYKWHLSPLDVIGHTGCRKAVPTFEFSSIWKDWHLGLYLEMALKRAAQNATPGPWVRKEERYAVGPSIEEAIEILREL